MRKPLLVVCGATAAVLLAGGIAAATAGADETPDRSSMPALSFPDLPTFPAMPRLGGGADAAGGDTAPVGATGSDDQPAGDTTNQTSGDGRFPDRPGGASAATDEKPADGKPAADRRPAPGEKPAGDQRPAAVQKPAADQNAADAKPAATRADRQAAAEPVSAVGGAQRELSPAQVSTSATAPFQQQVLALINENRRRGGCDPVSLDRRLILAAYGHAADMARRNYFAHESLNGDGAGDRVTDAGFQWSRYGENIARGPSSAYEVVDGWMHSPVHRENIMDCRFREMGIGLAFSGDDESYWVQDFATPRE